MLSACQYQFSLLSAAYVSTLVLTPSPGLFLCSAKLLQSRQYMPSWYAAWYRWYRHCCMLQQCLIIHISFSVSRQPVHDCGTIFHPDCGGRDFDSFRRSLKTNLFGDWSA